MQWYYVRENQRQGPLAQSEFDGLVANGTITPATLVWRAGMAEWLPYSTVAAGGGTATATMPGADDTEVCAVSGKRYPRREMIQYEGKWISAEHRDTFFQQLREGVPVTGAGAVPGPYGYGGFWLRAGARIVDGIILWVVNMVIGFFVGMAFGVSGAIGGRNMTNVLLMQGIILALSLGVNLAYEAFFVRKFDATPGKMALGLKILRADGEKLTVPRILGRQLGQWVSGIILGIGYIMAGVDEEKRALHDRMCDTRVVRTRR